MHEEAQAKNTSADNISKARAEAVQLIYDVTEQGAYANLALMKTLRHSKLSPIDRNLLTQLVNGTIRMLKHLDWVLNLFLKQDISKQNPWLRNILRVSAYQIMFMERIPDFACVNDAVELTRKRCNANLARVTNGVLRNLVRNKDNIKYPPQGSKEYLAVYYSHPQELVDKLLTLFGAEQSKNILVYNNQPARVDFRFNTLKTTRDDLIQELHQNGVKCCASPFVPCSIRIEDMKGPLEELPPYKEGRFYVQNEASMLATLILDPLPGEKVLDLCCGVGGKTTHIAEKMQNQGLIKAYDSYSRKIDILKTNCTRLGIKIVNAIAQDIMLLEENQEAERVMLDAPCSGSGVLNRRSDARWNKDIQAINQLTDLQLQFLEKAGSLVGDGGYLLYSTCSVLPAENEEIVQAFIANNPFELEGFDQKLDFFPLDSRDKENAGQGMLTLIPGKYDTDGMFFALMRKNEA
ncbi:MAG: 16S rRNA (cytosine(967)-C(5))-methyltransferase RsmB [Syntrophomonadaceae bacterium]|nr:16S rRNA (cytosine(967)-C(5))-methyltransferase RsmB [Syntrophomonadaceae bacterium]